MDYFHTKMPAVPLKILQNLADQTEFPEISNYAKKKIAEYIPKIYSNDFIKLKLEDPHTNADEILKKLKIRKESGNHAENLTILSEAISDMTYTKDGNFDPENILATHT